METIILKGEFSHPIVILLGQRGDITQAFLCAEGRSIPVQHGPVDAVQRMLQLYYIMNMEYAEPARHVLQFLQRVVLGIDDDLPMSRSGSDLALFIKKGMQSRDQQ